MIWEDVMDQTRYGMRRTGDMSYEDAVAKVRETLQAEGFGVLTEIDVKATLKKKLDVDFRKYVILGACNPPCAYRALQVERDIGLLLPCNVIVYEEDGGGTVVAAMDPVAAMGMIENPEVADVAEEVQERLERAVQAIG